MLCLYHPSFAAAAAQTFKAIK